MKEVQSQSSFLSCNDFRLHFGLGSALVADVSVRWPNGKRQSLTALRRTSYTPSGKAQASLPIAAGNDRPYG